jgi:DNA invertase Pin-like site-specific DNA recombinase
MTKDEIRRVIGYVRVSTVDQSDSGAGQLAQQQAIEAKVAAKGWQLVRIARDIGSGKSLNGRHDLKAALAELKAHKADALVVAKLDRLSRSVPDFGMLLETARRQGWHVVMLDLELDTSTPMGKAMANMAMTFAQFEREMIGLRTKEALAVKRSQGVRLGRERMVSPELEKRIHRLRLRGLSYELIAKQLTADGIASPMGNANWSWQSVSQIVNRAPARVVKLHQSGRLMETASGELVPS